MHAVCGRLLQSCSPICPCLHICTLLYRPLPYCHRTWLYDLLWPVQQQIWLSRGLTNICIMGFALFSLPVITATALCKEVQSSFPKDEWLRRAEMSCFSHSPKGQAYLQGYTCPWSHPRPHSSSWHTTWPQRSSKLIQNRTVQWMHRIIRKK